MAIPSAVESRSGVRTRVRRRSGWRLLRHRELVVGGTLVALVLIVALFAGVIAPYSPYKPDFANVLQGPSGQHWLGTDVLGRDVLSRILFGARTSMEVTVGAAAVGLTFGVPVGLLSGYYGGVVDHWIVMRAVDALQAFPFLVLALVLAAVLGPGIGNAMIAIGVGYIPGFVRIVRGQAISEVKKEYVQSARCVGAGDWRVMVRHILPNVLSPLIVQISMAMASGIVAEASLSYLGLGAQPPTPSWGTMLKTGQGYLTMAPWLSLAPGLALVVVVFGFNLLGDGLREWLDPHTSRE